MRAKTQTPIERTYARPEERDDFATWYAELPPRFEDARTWILSMLATTAIDDEFERATHRKAQAGWLRHGGGIRSFDSEDFQREIMDEIRDLIVYVAAWMRAERVDW